MLPNTKNKESEKLLERKKQLSSNEKIEAQAQLHILKSEQKNKEIGGPSGPEPTRFGDWSIGGRTTDF